MSSPEAVRFPRPLRSVRLVAHGAAGVSTDEMNARIEEAFRRGSADGAARSNQQILDQRDEVNQLRAHLFRSLEEAVAAAVAEVRTALPGLAMAALRRVLARIEIDEALVDAVVGELLAEIGPDTGPIEVRLHPADLALVQRFEPRFAAEHPGLRFVADESLARGDSQAVTRFGKIDARLLNKIDRLEATLAGSA